MNPTVVNPLGMYSRSRRKLVELEFGIFGGIINLSIIYQEMNIYRYIVSKEVTRTRLLILGSYSESRHAPSEND